MKRVKIEIEVEVPDGYKWVAVDSDGEITATDAEPVVSQHGSYWEKSPGDNNTQCRIINWRETLTEVNDGRLRHEANEKIRRRLANKMARKARKKAR